MTRSRGREIGAWAALVLLAALFVVAGQRMFAARYVVGDVYPSFSSHSSEPDGTRALFASLAALGEPEVRRNHRPLGRLVDDPSLSTSPTVIVAGLPSWALASASAASEPLDGLAGAGARMIVTLVPRGLFEPRPLEEREPEGTEGAGDGEGRDGEGGETGLRDEGAVALERASRWAFELVEAEEAGSVVRRVSVPSGLPATIAWRSDLRLRGLGEAWTVLYADEAGAVLAERSLGRGSVVLATGSDFLTNRALGEDRQTALISHLLGSPSRIVFDESHLGVVHSPGVVALARRYRLHGIAVALAVVLVLAVWRAATRMMPPGESAASTARGRDSREGLVALLRRSIPERRLLRTCFEHWSATGDPAAAPEEARRISQASDPVGGYRRLVTLLEPEHGAERRL